MNKRKSGKTQIQAAAKANLSERSGRHIDSGSISVNHKQNHHWKTRKDPLKCHWQSIVYPFLESNPALNPITIHEYLCDNYPEKYDTSCLRTLQRRIKQWRLTHVPERKVIFRKEKIPTDMNISDFTLLK